VKRQTALRLKAARLPPSKPDVNMTAMKILATVILAIFVSAISWAQTPNDKSSAAQLEAISKKLDEQNAKIDALSQQILKLQEQVSKPGVMIGEASPTPSTSSASLPETAHAPGTTHTVTRGETLTSIAKQYKVGVDELQRFNHIEDGRKLQAGQTIMIPTAGAASPAPSAEPSLAPND
jgi:LysM repeat protein